MYSQIKKIIKINFANWKWKIKNKLMHQYIYFCKKTYLLPLGIKYKNKS